MPCYIFVIALKGSILGSRKCSTSTLNSFTYPVSMQAFGWFFVFCGFLLFRFLFCFSIGNKDRIYNDLPKIRGFGLIVVSSTFHNTRIL